MKGSELRLMREFKNIEKSYEDFLMTEINEEISKFIDKKGYEKYKQEQEICKDIKKTISLIIDYESLKVNCNEFIEKVKHFYSCSDENIHYFDNQNGIIKEVLFAIKPKVDPQMDKLEALSYFCNIKGYNKTSNNMRFGIKKLKETRETLLIDIILSSTREYRRLLIEEFESADCLIKEKIEEIQSYKLDEKMEPENKKLKKILDCDNMDSFLRSLKYIPVRQKNGSHLIYKKDNVRTIPVPQHKSLNKGLGYGIQREIFRNEQ